MSTKHKAGRHWLIERITAVALIPLCLWLVIQLANGAGADQLTAAAFLQSPINAILTAAIVIIGFWHAAMGVQVVLEDYVHDLKKRKNSICTVNFICLALAAISLASIVKLALA